MTGLFVLLFLASIVGFIISMVNPALFARIFISTRKTAALFFGSLLILSVILIGFTGSLQQANVKGESINAPTATATLTPTPTISPTLTPTSTPIPIYTPTTIPTLKPTNTSTPTIYIAPTKTSVQTSSPTNVPEGLSNDDYYTNVDGNQVHAPAYSNQVPAGATAICGDGTYSFSQHRSGTCSHHGGVAQWLQFRYLLKNCLSQKTAQRKTLGCFKKSFLTLETPLRIYNAL